MKLKLAYSLGNYRSADTGFSFWAVVSDHLILIVWNQVILKGLETELKNKLKERWKTKHSHF